jgi:hypothetical protein
MSFRGFRSSSLRAASPASIIVGDALAEDADADQAIRRREMRAGRAEASGFCCCSLRVRVHASKTQVRFARRAVAAPERLDCGRSARPPEDAARLRLDAVVEGERGARRQGERGEAN